MIINARYTDETIIIQHTITYETVCQRFLTTAVASNIWVVMQMTEYKKVSQI